MFADHDERFEEADEEAAERNEAIANVLARMKTEMFPKLMQEGVAKIVADYCGSSDEGCIHSCDFFDRQDRPISVDESVSVLEIEDLLSEFMPHGFEDDAGGQGNITVDVEAATVTLEHGENYIETEYSTRRWKV